MIFISYFIKVFFIFFVFTPYLANAGNGAETRISWGDCENRDLSGLKCGVISVPLDNYGFSNNDKVQIAVSKLAAKNPIGDILFIAGGPGEASFDLNAVRGNIPKRVLDSYNLIGYAPRGVYPSSPQILCNVNSNLAQDFVDACNRASGDFLRYIGTKYAVRDIEYIRKSLGIEKLNIISYSYGTKVAALYAMQYPANLASAVLDGVVDLGQGYKEQRISQERGYQNTFDAFAKWCSYNFKGCFFSKNEDFNSQFYKFLRHLDNVQLKDAEKEVISPDRLIDVIISNVLWQEEWGSIAKVIKDLSKNKVASFNRLKYDNANVNEELNNANSNNALTAINCADSASGLSKKEELQKLIEIDNASLFDNYKPKGELDLLEPCSLWKYTGSDFSDDYILNVKSFVPDVKMPKLLFVTNTQDGTTPFENAQNMAKLFNSHLLVRKASGHILTFQGISSCVDNNVLSYIKSPASFKSGMVCK